jgi:N-carbamoylputrescine amidase
MKIAVAEFPDEAVRHESAWADLIGFLDATPADVLVLPEMPFVEWHMFTSDTVDRAAWRAALDRHDAMIDRFAELGAAVVLASRPVERGGRRLNQAFGWTRDGGYRAARAKYYLPDEPDGREADWFERGDRHFRPTAIGSLQVGFQLCTELLFSDAAHEIGRGGAELLAAPRATGGHPRWPIAASLAAVMSGCFVASANRRSIDGDAFAGRSWVVSPEGEMLAETSAAAPFAVIEVDLADAVRAKASYPRTLEVS